MPIPGGPRPSHTPPRHLSEVAAQLAVSRPDLIGHEIGREVGREVDPATGPEVDPATGTDEDDVLITGVSLGSRSVRPGDLYAALPGARAHGADYAGEAQRAGAVAVLTDAEGARRVRTQGVTLPVITVETPRARLGALAAWLYGRPAERLHTFGVTGTNGKTTTTFLLDGALRTLGYHTGLIGTVELRVDTEVVPSTGTTPEAPDLHALLAVMLEHGVDACSMEISSHALAQHRVDGLTVDVAGYTNLSRDHLDYHRTMAEYFEAKAVLFSPPYAHRAVVCLDDDWGRRLAERVQADGVPLVTVGARPTVGDACDWQVLSIEHRGGLAVAQLQVRHDGREQQVRLPVPLPGDFNLANAVLAAAMLTEAYPVDPVDAVAAVARSGPVPGRMERVDAATRRPGAPLAVVDYAHTPDAVRAALEALRATAKPLVVVLGAGGDRDREKRPMMGAAAAAVADMVVITDDNPRSEDPAAIRAAVLTGARDRASAAVEVLEIGDRRAAIVRAVELAWTDAGTGVVLVAGKGHERGQEIVRDGVSEVHPFDDRQVLREVLESGR